MSLESQSTLVQTDFHTVSAQVNFFRYLFASSITKAKLREFRHAGFGREERLSKFQRFPVRCGGFSTKKVPQHLPRELSAGKAIGHEAGFLRGLCTADDSGLVVPALGQRARSVAFRAGYAGPECVQMRMESGNFAPRNARQERCGSPGQVRVRACTHPEAGESTRFIFGIRQRRNHGSAARTGRFRL